MKPVKEFFLWTFPNFQNSSCSEHFSLVGVDISSQKLVRVNKFAIATPKKALDQGSGTLFIFFEQVSEIPISTVDFGHVL